MRESKIIGLEGVVKRVWDERYLLENIVDMKVKSSECNLSGVMVESSSRFCKLNVRCL